MAVWFCDVVGSTEIAGELGDRRFRQIVARFLAIVRSTLRRHGGVEIDTAGDGMFATFETPAAALTAAWEATAAVRSLGIEIRSGINLGEVERDPDGRVGGIAVHLGARVTSLADAGEVLTTRTTSELASGAGFLFEERGTRELKGIPGRHAIVAVVGSDGAALEPPLETEEARRRRATATGTSAPAERRTALQGESSRPFVGRASELDELLESLVDAVAGHGSLSLICGEPGIGKSRLITAVVEHAEAHGWAVLVGRCWEGGGAPAYWPWMQVVREAGGEFSRIADAEHVTPTPGRTHHDVVSNPTDPDTARFELFHGVERYLADIARERPSLIVLEDLHAADEPSLLLLRFVASSVREHPLVILGSYRENHTRVRELADLFGNLAKLGRRLPLRGLNSREVASFIALSSGDVPSDALAVRISGVTGGNPFFVGEIVRELAARGRLTSVEDSVALPLPEEVRAVIRWRVDDLSPEATILLQIAAVIGREFDLRVISAATTLTPDRRIDALTETERAGAIVERHDAPGTYVFAHDLLRETVYGDIPAAHRMELHRIVGGVLEDLFRDEPVPHLAEIAHHLVLAAPLGEAERAIEFSIRAADRSRDVLAYEDAAELYEQALRLLTPATAASLQTAQIHLKLGDVRSRAGDVEGALRSFEQAAMIARGLESTETFGLAALGYGAAELRASPGGLLTWLLVKDSTTSIALLEEALDSLPPNDGPLRARALAMLATELYSTDHRERRLAMSREAIDMATRLAHPEVLLEALRSRHWATFAPDTLHERLDNAQQMLLTATEAGNDEFAFFARHARAHCFLELCQTPAMEIEIEAMDQLAGRIRQTIYVWHVATLRGVRPLLDGHLAEAETRLRGAMEVSGLGDDTYVRYVFEYAELLAIRWAQGRLDDVLDRIAEHAVRFPQIPRWRDALVAVELGEEKAAKTEVERFAREGFSTMPSFWLLHASTIAEACVLLRDERRAAILYELLAPYSDRNAIAVTAVPFGPVATRLGMLATLLERWTDAERYFERAKSLCDAMGARAIRARVLVEQARMLRTRDGMSDRARVEDLLSEAANLCEELELSGISERVAALSRVGNV